MSPDSNEKIEQHLEVSGSAGNVIQIAKATAFRITQLVDKRILKQLRFEQQLGFVLTAILIMGSMIGLYLALRPHHPQRMIGDFRIAVLGFAETGYSKDMEDTDLGLELAQSVFLRLEQELDEANTDLTTTIWGPEQVGTVHGESDEARAEDAAKTAQRIGADLIVYGLVDRTDIPWRIIPEFYVSADNFHEAEEITGQHDMGNPITVTAQGNIADRINVSTRFASRAQALVRIAIGLAYYSIRNFEKSLIFLESAEDIEGWQDEEGKQVLYLLIGNAAGKSGDLESAEKHYSKALSLDPEYARGYAGLASVFYMQALKPFEETLEPSDVDSGLLELAIATHQQALEAINRPDLSDIPTKVHFGLGQCHFMLVYSGNSQLFDSAAAEFQAVIDAYDNGANPRVRELAAEAHAGLARIFDLAGHVEGAIEEYLAAASLLDKTSDRRAHFEKRARELQGEGIGD